jgi:hypothetical protein
MNTEELVNGIAEAAILRPGDTLVVRVGDTVTHKNINEFSDHLRAKFKEQVPDVAVFVMGGVEQLLVYRPDEHDGHGDPQVP